MSLLQGNTYSLPIQIGNPDGSPIDIQDIQKAQFVIGKVEKFYDGTEEGTVTYDAQTGSFLVPLTEEETFGMGNSVKWQVRILFANGKVDGTAPVAENVIEHNSYCHYACRKRRAY